MDNRQKGEPITSGFIAGCGFILAVVGLAISATIFLAPIGVPLALLGGYMVGYGFTKLFG